MTRLLATMKEAECGEFDDRTGFGALQTARGALPLIALDVKTCIVDLTANTTVRQKFRNSLDEPLEATYIFPLPDRAAVTSFRMVVAGRVIDGDLKERGQARQEYDRAIKVGHRAAIAEEERSGVFTLRVGNIPPREDATIELTLVGPLPVADGEATFRFPLIVAPRYTSGIPLDGPSVGMGVTPDTDQVPDASRVTPPVLLPGFPNPVAFSLEVQLDPMFAGMDTESWRRGIQSSLHGTITEEGPPWTIRVQPGERLNRDFILRFPVGGAAIASSLAFSPAVNGKPGVFALTIVPPALPAAKPKPREIVFLLDRSGSMAGWKIVAARRAVGRMIDTLLEQDRFTVLAFDNQLESPPGTNDSLASATDRHRWQMLEWLGKLDARGGTELGPALDAAMRLFTSRASSDESQAILVLVTDGQVSGEDAVLKRLAKSGQKRLPRIFTIGIDQAVNAAFLKRLAGFGKGECEFVESEDRLDAAMDRIHRLIGTPVLTGLKLEPLDFDCLTESQAPARLPDLFIDRPVTLYGRHLALNDGIRLKLHGTDAAGKPWQEEVTGRPADSAMLAAVWGRARVRDLEDQYACGQTVDNRKLMQQIVEVSLESRVLSRFTAYVAVDRAEIVNAGGHLQQIVQPVELPAGWENPVARAIQAVTFYNRMRGAPRSASRLEDDDLLADASFSLMESDSSESADSMLQEFSDTAIDFTQTLSESEELELSDPDSSPIVRLVQLILAEAHGLRANRIQMEPHDDCVSVMYWIDGQMIERDSPPLRLFGAVIERIKRLANLDPACHTLQTGRLQVEVNSQTVTWSVTIQPSPYGETVTLTLESAELPKEIDIMPKTPREAFWT